MDRLNSISFSIACPECEQLPYYMELKDSGALAMA